MCCERVCVCVCVSAWPLGSQGYFYSDLSLSIQGRVRPLIHKLPKSESETAEPPALNFTCSPPQPPLRIGLLHQPGVNSQECSLSLHLLTWELIAL